MADHVDWILELSVTDGKLDDLKTLMSEMVEATKTNEPGALIYEWSASADGGTVHIYERYADSAATMVHLTTFGHTYAERFFALAKPERFVVYGSPDDEVRAALDPLGVTYMAPIGGFARDFEG
ncbi:antibiotic biosynthesis monooxygenase [Breoghania sp. L-A4]|uniref:putative quinol monooxygenase n=1 Tax=Breoghania sp. L-A4 TaxID=2304600 RepID=UPI000E3607CD|nr:antibiotic biosynthesis monooxygenase [Breoghania sp. L-A4]AXS39465.1 antibiotic biosynthesis monooxygenase [Breoghania sp. L-A4]